MGGCPKVGKAAALRIAHPNLSTEQAMLAAGFTEEEAKCYKGQQNVRQRTHRIVTKEHKRKAAEAAEKEAAEAAEKEAMEEGSTSQRAKGDICGNTKEVQPEIPQPSTTTVSSYQNNDPLDHYAAEIGMSSYEQEGASNMFQFSADTADFANKQDTSQQTHLLSIKWPQKNDEETQQTTVLLEGLQNGQEKIMYNNECTLEKVSILDQRVTLLNQKVTGLFQNVDNKVDRLGQKVDTLDHKVSTILALQERILRKIEGSNIDTELSDTDEEG